MSRFGNNSSPHPVVRPEPFAGREQLIAQFKAYALAGRDDPPPILCYFGIGGQGKSTLLRQLHRWCQEEGHPSVRIDLDRTRGGAGYSDPGEGLQAIAAGLADAGLKGFYKRFLLVRSLIETRRTGQRWEMAGGSGEWGLSLAELAVTAFSLGTLGGFLQAGQIVWGAFPGVQTWLSDLVRDKDWKERSLQSLSNEELTALLPHALAADFEALFEDAGGRDGKRACRPIVLLDTFEDLQRAGTGDGDRYIRALAEATDKVLLVIGGRLQLEWDQTECEAGEPCLHRGALMGGSKASTLCTRSLVI